MAIVYPLDLPTTKAPAQVVFSMHDVVGVSESPWTFEQQAQAMEGARWEAEITLPPMKRENAAAWIGFFGALRGRAGYFYLSDTVSTAVRGTWAGSPKVLGAHAARVSSIAMDGFSAGATIKAGDYFQEGTGSSRHLHVITQDATANGSGELTAEVWPPTRVALSDNATFTIASPKGVFRLASNVRQWTIELAQLYGFRFSAVEKL